MAHDANKIDPKNALRGFLVLDILVRLSIYGGSLVATLMTMTGFRIWPDSDFSRTGFQDAWEWATAITIAVILFNAFYVLCLVLFRLPIPQPKPGRYSLKPGQPLNINLVWSCLIATLTKARHEPPFPAFLVFQVANIPPFCWLMGPIFGPKSASCYVAEPTIIDPHLVTIGRNVVIGFGTTIAGHYQEQNEIVIQPTIIEDDVLIGAHSALSGAHVKRGAMIGAGSVVMPGTVIGPNEYWSGNPARRRKYLTPEAGAQGAAAGESPLDTDVDMPVQHS